MTPEEKTKRYNEALEMAKIAHKDEDRHLKATLERIFPELKENKDEKTKKAIIDIIKSQKEQQCHIDGAIYDKMIVWLEKQGRYANFRNKIQIGDKVTRNEDGALVNLSQLKRIAKEYNITGIGSKHAQGKLGEMIKNLKPVNETLEQNHANKAEPKFHEGEWIVWQDKCYKVNYNGCGYELTDQNGKSTSLEYGAVDKTANLWRIQDAKAGDVLYSPKDPVVERIVLIGGWKQLDGYSTLCAPITYRVKENEIEVPIVGAIWWNGVINSFCPATKEQRDKLEKAMADAGYTFDFEKKELKKIESEIEMPYGAKDSELQEDTYFIPKGFHAEIDGDKVVIKKGEKSTAWNKDDEYRVEELLGWLSALINYIHEDAMVSLDLRRERMQQVEQIKTWLVSLKDRIHPKNNYNPYKEVVESIAKMCEKYDKYSHSILKDFFDNVKVKCKDAKEFDSLHPQNTKAISQ